MAEAVSSDGPPVSRPVLRSVYDAAENTISIELVGGHDVPAGSRLALTSVVQLTPPPGAAVQLARRVASYHEFSGVATPRLTGLRLSHRPHHANDGPVSAFVIRPDGTTSVIEVEPMRRLPELEPPASRPVEPAGVDVDAAPSLVPFPRSVDVRAPGAHRTVAFGDGPEPARRAWRAISALERRTRSAAALGADGGLTVTATLDPELVDERYTITVEPDRADVTAGSDAGFRHAFVTLARWLPSGLPERLTVDDWPQYSWRGLHIDLARQWFEPDLVERLVDVCAWRKLSRLHLHLTDDEAWRLPVDDRPDLAVVGATRGHGLFLPPMLGGGPEPSGRAYTHAEIARWVDRADELGVVLVPEFDVPGHVHAALTALPSLRDPADVGGARSVQFFDDNVLVPGHPATEEFLSDVVDSVVALFPSSPWIHIGGDEVPDGAWNGSPIVAGLRAEHGLGTTREVEAEFHRRLVALIRERTGRRVGAWQEAVESGGVRPGDGYAVGWRSIEVGRRLAAAGHDVVVAPSEAYYLDMAIDHDWRSPGASWAGATSLEDVCAFVPDDGWSADERAHLIGVQACLWTEHVHDHDLLDRMLFPRLDGVAERAWTGAVVGGPESLRRRSR